MILIRKFLVYYSIPVQVNLDEIVEFMSGIGFVPNFLYSKLNYIRMLVINRVVMFYVNKKLLLTTVPVPIYSVKGADTLYNTGIHILVLGSLKCLISTV